MKNRRIIFSFLDIIVSIYFLATFFPQMNYWGMASLICVLSFFLVFVLIAIVDLRILLSARSIIQLVTLGVTVLYCYVFGYSVIAHRYLSLAMVLCGTIIYDFYKAHGQQERLKKICYVMIVFTVITMITTLLSVLKDSYVSRRIKAYDEYGIELSKKGVGGYSFIYYVALLSIVFLFLAHKNEDRWKKNLLFALYLFCFILIIKASFFTALLVIILGSVTLVLSEAILTMNRKRLFFSLLIIVIGFIVMAYWNQIIGLVMPFLPIRIRQVFTGNNTSFFNAIIQEFIFDRFPVMQESINVFIRYPLLGSVGNGAIARNNGFLSGFGQHSHVLDSFALLGFGLGFLNLVVLFIPFSRSRRKKQTIGLTLSLLISSFVVYLFNNATESIGFVCTIIYPLLRDSIDQTKTAEIRGSK